MAKHIGIACILDKARNADTDVVVDVYVGDKNKATVCHPTNLYETILECVDEISIANERDAIIHLLLSENGEITHVVYPESKFDWVMKRMNPDLVYVAMCQ